MKQIIELELVNNKVVSKTEYIYTPETKYEFKLLNFTNTDVVLKVEGIREDSLLIKAVNILVKPATMSEIYIPIKYKRGLEEAFDELACDYEETLKEIKELKEKLNVIIENLEG